MGKKIKIFGTVMVSLALMVGAYGSAFAGINEQNAEERTGWTGYKDPGGVSDGKYTTRTVKVNSSEFADTDWFAVVYATTNQTFCIGYNTFGFKEDVCYTYCSKAAHYAYIKNARNSGKDTGKKDACAREEIRHYRGDVVYYKYGHIKF